MPRTKESTARESGDQRLRVDPTPARGNGRSVQGWITVQERQALGHILADENISIGEFATAAIRYWIQRGRSPMAED